jgi:cytochrome c oxidase assembly protein subunit 15
MRLAAFNWTHLVACLLVGVTAVLLSFGALVTTYEAAMAVPDWPGTYGHNMFLFPLADWLHGPWDLFLEHGHRLLGAATGLVAVLLAAVAWRSDARPVVRWLTIAAVALVVVQGALGGARVLLDDKTVAKVHACTGPLFFAVAVAIAALSRRSAVAARQEGITRLPVALLVASYLQLVAGAQLRHLDATVSPATFHAIVAVHVAGACAVTMLAIACAVTSRSAGALARRWSWLMVAVVIGQMALGAGAWVVSWGLPSGLLPEAWMLAEPLRARSGWSAAVVTGHVVLGMLILGGSVILAIESGGFGRHMAGPSGDGRHPRGDVVSAPRAFA